MKPAIRSLDKLIEDLPPNYQEEVFDFVSFLLEKNASKKSIKPQFKWAGALKTLSNKYSSVQLQHKISTLRIKDK